MRNPFRRKCATAPDPDATTHGEAVFPCNISPQDRLFVRSFRGRAPGVSLTAKDGDDHSLVAVVLTPTRARVLAAAILNAADNASGSAPDVPLVVAP